MLAKRIRILFTLLALCVALPSFCAKEHVANTSARPKLVVYIVVDQLRTDYLEMLLPRMGQNGFAKLANNGVYMRNVSLGLESADKASATALLYTGAYPEANGIPGEWVYEVNSAVRQNVFHDPQQLGNYTQQTLSPRNLLLSTISDEIMIDGAGMGAVYSISVDPAQSLAMAAHAGSNAAWLNTDNGQWATSTYYRTVPQPLQTANTPGNSIASRIDTMRWKPMFDIKTYDGIPAHKRQYPFMHTFAKSDANRYDRLAVSAIANREITDLAIQYIDKLALGRRGDSMDMLNIAYSAAPYKYIKDGDYRLELQDQYLRLDADLARLFSAIDSSVGLNNALIVLTSTCYYNDAVKDDDVYRIPSGNFSTRRAMSLLNSYLVAKHGNGNYIAGHTDRQIYLDQNLLKQRNLLTGEIAEECKSFLKLMAGISQVYTHDDLLTPATEQTRLISRGLNMNKAGDVIYRVAPGWNLVDDYTLPETVTPVRYGKMLHPAFIMGNGLSSKTIDNEVEAVSLAPTISSLLKIRTPNGATHLPISL